MVDLAAKFNKRVDVQELAAKSSGHLKKLLMMDSITEDYLTWQREPTEDDSAYPSCSKDALHVSAETGERLVSVRCLAPVEEDEYSYCAVILFCRPAEVLTWPAATAISAAIASLGEGVVENVELDVLPREVMSADEIIEELALPEGQLGLPSALSAYRDRVRCADREQARHIAAHLPKISKLLLEKRQTDDDSGGR